MLFGRCFRSAVLSWPLTVSLVPTTMRVGICEWVTMSISIISGRDRLEELSSFIYIGQTRTEDAHVTQKLQEESTWQSLHSTRCNIYFNPYKHHTSEIEPHYKLCAFYMIKHILVHTNTMHLKWSLLMCRRNITVHSRFYLLLLSFFLSFSSNFSTHTHPPPTPFCPEGFQFKATRISSFCILITFPSHVRLLFLCSSLI